jgi:protein subunit release factor B
MTKLHDQDLEWHFFRASGPGGQHRNKVETGVRLVHLPTGLTASATERRSRLQNQKIALERLVRKLAEASRPVKTRKPTRPSAAARNRRLQAKKARAKVKSLRRRPDSND